MLRILMILLLLSSCSSVTIKNLAIEKDGNKLTVEEVTYYNMKEIKLFELLCKEE